MEPQTLAAGLLSACVFASVLSIGSVHLPALVCVALLGFASAAAALRQQARTREGLAIPVPALVCGALALYSLIQAVPLPMRVLETLSPSAADVWQRSLIPLGEHGPAWASLSLDPGATCVEALRWMTYAAVFTASSAISSSHGADWGLRIVWSSAVVVALITLGHGLTGATSVYGIYKPDIVAAQWHVAPLLNPNNLSGYLNLGALTGLGLLLGRRPWIPRWIIGLGVAVLVGVDITTASRAGVGALVASVVLFAVFMRRARREGEAMRGGGPLVAVVMLAVVAAGVAFAFLGGNEKVWRELFDRDLSKLTMALWAKPVVRDFPIFGVGRGAFESVFPAYRMAGGASLYAYAENFVVQWVVDWGLPVALAALAYFAWTFRPSRLGVPRSLSAAGAFCGVFALLAQNLLDLALEVPGVVIALAAVLGALFGDRHRTRRHDAVRIWGQVSPSRANLAGGATFGLGLGLALLAVGCGRWNIDRDRDGARELALAPRVDMAATRSKLHDAMVRHPAEPYFSLLGAYVALRTHDGNPLPWLQRALERASVNGPAHLLLAQALDRRGARSQALLELRLAVEDDPWITGRVAQFATQMTHSFESLAYIAPEGTKGTELLMAMSGIVAALPGEDLLLSQLDRETIKRDPTLLAPRQREAEARIRALATPEAASSVRLCPDRARCRDEVMGQVDAAARYHPRSNVGPILRAQLLMAEGEPEAAARFLESACSGIEDQASCLRVRAQAAAGVKAPGLLDAASKDLLAVSCSTARSCAEAASMLAGMRSARGETGTALVLLSQAAREDPNDDTRWLRVADAASAAGAHGDALSALERVARHRGGKDAAVNARVEAERAQVGSRMYMPPVSPPRR